MPIHPVAITVRDHVTELVAASAGERSIEVEIEIPSDLMATIDQTVFERVVSNLLTNALRHGDSPVLVTAARQDRHFRIAVQDCGNGVPAEFVDDLFERSAAATRPRARPRLRPRPLDRPLIRPGPRRPRLRGRRTARRPLRARGPVAPRHVVAADG